MGKIKLYKFNLILICFFSIIFIFCIENKVFAENDDLKINGNIVLNNVTTVVNNVYRIEVIPSEKNQSGAIGKPDDIKVVFENEIPTQLNTISKNFEIDFSKVQYTKKGLYIYNVFESESSNNKLYPISNEKYQIYVKVIENNGKLQPTVLTQIGDPDEGTKKEKLEFENNINNTYIEIKNINTGKIYDKDEYFKYKLFINAPIGSRFSILGQDEWVVFNGEKIKTEKIYEITNDKNFVYIYLKSEQLASIGISYDNDKKFYEIPLGTEYEIIQLESRKSKTYMNGVELKSFKGIATEKNFIEVINEKDFDIALTGMFINILPFIVLIVIAVIIIVALIKQNKKTSWDDDE